MGTAFPHCFTPTLLEDEYFYSVGFHTSCTFPHFIFTPTSLVISKIFNSLFRKLHSNYFDTPLPPHSFTFMLTCKWENKRITVCEVTGSFSSKQVHFLSTCCKKANKSLLGTSKTEEKHNGYTQYPLIFFTPSLCETW